jgi:hypothetical protein
LSYFWILRYFYSGARIARYIKEKIEPQTGLGWEKWVNSIRRETEPDGKVKVSADTFSVFYHSLLILSLVVCLVLIWAPLWSSGNATLPSLQSAQTSSLDSNTRTIFSGIAVVFWIVWYLFARWIFIAGVKHDTRKMMSALQRQENTAKNK